MPTSDPQAGPASATVGPPRAATFLRNIERWLLLATVGLLPLACVPTLLLDVYNLPKVTLVMGAVALAGSLRLASISLGSSARNLRALALPAGVMGGAFLLSWLVAEYPAWSLMGSYTRYGGLLPYLAVILFGLLLADAFAGSPRPVIIAVVLGGAAVGMGALIQMLFFGFAIGETSQTGYVTSTVGHSNFLGGYLAIVLAISVALWLGEGRIARLGMVASIPAFLGLLFTVSQGAWSGGLAALMVVGGRHLRQRRKRAGLAGTVIGAMVGLAGAVAVTVTMLVPHAYARVPGYLKTTASRGLLWEHALALGAERPLLGWGPNAYAIEGPLHRSVEDALLQNFTQGDDPHSYLLALLANQGVVGVAAFLFVLLWAFRRAAGSSSDPVVAAAVVGGLVAYAAQALVSIDEITIRFNFWILVAASACLAAPSDGAELRAALPRPSGAVRGKARAAAALLAISIGAAGAYLSFSRLVVADWHVARGLHLFHELGAGRHARAEFARALTLRDDNAYRREYGGVLGELAYQEGPGGEPLIEEMHDVFSYLDHLPDIQALALQGQLTYQWSLIEPEAATRALGLYNRVLQLDPHNPNAARETADILTGLDRAEEAEALLEPYERLLVEVFPEFSPLYGEYWAGLAIARARQGELVHARETLRRAGEKGGCRFLIARLLLETPGLSAEQATASPAGLPLGLVCPPTLLRLLPGEDSPRTAT